MTISQTCGFVGFFSRYNNTEKFKMGSLYSYFKLDYYYFIVLSRIKDYL